MFTQINRETHKSEELIPSKSEMLLMFKLQYPNDEC